MTQTTRLETGRRIREEVLGHDHVQRSLTNGTEFTRPMQELVTEYCWGTVWARPGLDKKTRSLLNIAMLTALRQSEELDLHVHGAIRNGCTVTEIQETILQSAIYCGVPAALHAFRIAQAALGPLAEDGQWNQAADA
jgi:4-carboxymuconolactone decarboxylase